MDERVLYLKTGESYLLRKGLQDLPSLQNLQPLNPLYCFL